MSSKQSSYPNESDESYQTDTDLFLLLQKGQSEPLAILYDRHAGLVYGIASELLGNNAEAEDLTQDIFLLLTKKCSYDPKRGSLRTYLRILTRSRAIDRLRADNRGQKRLRDRALAENNLTFPLSPLEEISQSERSQEVKAALEQLSTKEREVLKMSYYQGLSQSEIARQLNTALGTVKSRSRRGLLKLRQALKDFGGRL